MTREEAIKMLRHCEAENRCYDGIHRNCKRCNKRTALDMAIEALEGVCFDEWCDDCKEYDTEKKCCPRFNKVIREAMKRIPHDEGTLEVKVEDATKVGRVLISDDKHRGGLYYPDEDEPKGDDLISRAEAIEAMGEEPLVWCDEEYEIAERYQWRADVEAIKSVPSADRPRPIDPTYIFDPESGVVPISACEPKAPKTIIYADRPRGKWIETAQDYYETVNKKGGGVNENTEYFTDDIACPNCLAKFSNIDNETERFNFCPNCGADMRGEDE